MDLPPVVRGWEPGEEEALLGVLSTQPQPYQQIAQSSPPPGSLDAATERLRRIASGEYAAQVEAERARQPAVNWSPAQIRAAARHAVASKLREPSSAQFRNVRRIQHGNGTMMFCGEVSGRNAYGGVSDFKRFEVGVTSRGGDIGAGRRSERDGWVVLQHRMESVLRADRWDACPVLGLGPRARTKIRALRSRGYGQVIHGSGPGNNLDPEHLRHELRNPTALAILHSTRVRQRQRTLVDRLD